MYVTGIGFAVVLTRISLMDVLPEPAGLLIPVIDARVHVQGVTGMENVGV
jgi:hypothetical protein